MLELDAKKILRRAAVDASRRMSAEAKRQVRARLNIKVRDIGPVLVREVPATAKMGNAFDAECTLHVSGKRAWWMGDFPHRQTPHGVMVEVRPGQVRLIPGAFVGTMTRAGGKGGSAVGSHGGHTNVYRRQGTKRLKISKQIGPRPLDALREGDAIKAVSAVGLLAIKKALDRHGADVAATLALGQFRGFEFGKSTNKSTSR